MHVEIYKKITHVLAFQITFCTVHISLENLYFPFAGNYNPSDCSKNTIYGQRRRQDVINRYVKSEACKFEISVIIRLFQNKREGEGRQVNRGKIKALKKCPQART